MSEQKPQQIPSVGRVVHVVTFDGFHRPADIVDPQDGETLCLLVKVRPTDLIRDGAAHNTVIWFIDDCPHDESKAPNTWHWPEYVPAK
jgi:hypothetical protein